MSDVMATACVGDVAAHLVSKDAVGSAAPRHSYRGGRNGHGRPARAPAQPLRARGGDAQQPQSVKAPRHNAPRELGAARRPPAAAGAQDVRAFFSFSFSSWVSKRPLATISFRSEYRLFKKSLCSRMIRVNLWYSSMTSTTRSRNSEGFIRPASSNSCHAFATEDWFVQHGIRIHRANRRSSLTTLKLWLPPFTCMTMHVRPCVGRTEPVLSGNQSIWFLNTPVIAPCISGLTHTWPSDHKDKARNSWTFGCISKLGSRTGKPCGSKVLTSAPINSSNRAHS
mmetsp:Transcript_18083/g.51075  ORF Transcript_18083/g.51075 Transcript_18083/m.51075 type:complete len:282 (+) Transcript_18083:62-907(+)